MKLTKTLLAVAVASIVAAPAYATTTLSGVVQVKLTGSDATDETIAAGDVRVGVHSEHDLNSGLTGYGNLQVKLDSLSGTANAATANDTYVGIKGDFGDVRMGKTPVPSQYGQFGNDIYGIGGDINDGISYEGNFGGATVGVAWSPEAGTDTVGFGAKYTVSGFTLGLGTEERAGVEHMSAGLSFDYAGASIGAHLGTIDTNDTEIVGVKVGYGISGVDLGFTFMTKTETAGDSEAVRLNLGYDLGGDMGVAVEVNQAEDAAGVESDDWKLQLHKSF